MMNPRNDHACTQRCICHLSDEAQVIYLALLYADQFDAAESLRTLGVPR